MAQNNGGLKKPVPVKSTFVYNVGVGESSGHAGKAVKGKDLRSKPGNNNGK
jgi:hypothetical protein